MHDISRVCMIIITAAAATVKQRMFSVHLVLCLTFSGWFAILVNRAGFCLVTLPLSLHIRRILVFIFVGVVTCDVVNNLF